MSGKNLIIQGIENAQLKSEVPEFGAGDTVTVQVKVKEGTRERLQAFQGVVIARRNRGLNSAFTVRKISHGVGVERVFQLHSPLIDSIEVNRRGDVSRAKLYYLRDRSGKSARIKEKNPVRPRAYLLSRANVGLAFAVGHAKSTSGQTECSTQKSRSRKGAAFLCVVLAVC